MKEYTIDIYDTKEHVYFSYVVLDYNLYSALKNAVEKLIMIWIQQVKFYATLML